MGLDPYLRPYLVVSIISPKTPYLGVWRDLTRIFFPNFFSQKMKPTYRQNIDMMSMYMSMLSSSGWKILSTNLKTGSSKIFPKKFYPQIKPTFQKFFPKNFDLLLIEHLCIFTL